MPLCVVCQYNFTNQLVLRDDDFDEYKLQFLSLLLITGSRSLAHKQYFSLFTVSKSALYAQDSIPKCLAR